MAMVVRANRRSAGIGGHISTFASAATLLEVGFEHFFRGNTPEQVGDQIYFQGHSSPGIYARAYLLRRLKTRQLENFRRELQPGGGLSSYPHPWLMPDFWEFPTVSMGLSPITAIYQARSNRYLQDRGLKDTSDGRNGKASTPTTCRVSRMSGRSSAMGRWMNPRPWASIRKNSTPSPSRSRRRCRKNRDDHVTGGWTTPASGGRRGQRPLRC